MAHPHVVFRPARLDTPEDVQEMLRIYAPHVTASSVSFEYDVPAAPAFAERCRSISARYPWLVCATEGGIAAYTYASPAFSRAAYQWGADVSVYVDTAWQRRSVAAALYACLEELLVLQGYYTLYACITASNKPSCAFHEKWGYQRIGLWRNSGYKLGQWHDVVWYEKALRAYGPNPAPPVPFPHLAPARVADILSRHAQTVG